MINIFGIKLPIGGKDKKGAPKNGQSVYKGQDAKKYSPLHTIKKQYRRHVSFEIDSIKTALLMAENPDMPDRSRLHEIYRYILRDAHLKGQIDNVMMPKVLSEPWLLYSGGTPDIAKSELLQQGWFNAIIRYILESMLHGYSLLELSEIDAKAMRAKVELVPREHVSIEFQWILIDGTLTGSRIEYGDIMHDLDLLEFGRRDDFGLLLECAYNVIWKYYSRSDWSRTSEKFGMPILHIKTTATGTDELNELENRAANLGTDGYVITADGDDATLMERTGQNIHLIYKDNVTLCDEQISKLINGGTASSDTKAFTGSAEVQERTLEDISSMRMQVVADAMNDQVLPYLVSKGFPLKGLRFDYPTLIRARQRRIAGQPLANDAKQTSQQAAEADDNNNEE